MGFSYSMYVRFHRLLWNVYMLVCIFCPQPKALSQCSFIILLLMLLLPVVFILNFLPETLSNVSRTFIIFCYLPYSSLHFIVLRSLIRLLQNYLYLQCNQIQQIQIMLLAQANLIPTSMLVCTVVGIVFLFLTCSDLLSV